ncbi:MAG: tetratricopeptide repeat protein [Endomicrobia bacterium]|nr:tetratricopeptide repeat protein [Endomicrobiia bacterium]
MNIKHLSKLFLVLLLTFFIPQIYCSFRKDINTGNKLFYKKRYDEAIKKYNEAEIKKPEKAVLYYNRGNAYYKQQLYEEAIKEYQKSLGLTKDKNLKSKILFNLGNAYLKIGDTQKAKQAYIQGLLNSPNDEDIKYNLQYALIELPKQRNSKSQQEQQKDKTEKQNSQKQQQKKYMSEQDVQRLIEAVGQQQKDKIKEALKPIKPQLPPVEKDW